MDHQTVLWIGFSIFVLVMLTLDLGVFHRKAHEVKFKEAVGWTGFWVSLALIFAAGTWYYRGSEVAMQFLAGYVIEQSLSVDNIFVFLVLFKFFRVPASYQHKVLFWGIIGVLIMRGIFIAVGVAVINKFEWTMYIFGAILIFTGLKMLKHDSADIHPENNPVLKLCRKLIPITKDYVNGNFFTRIDGKLWATPLFVTVLVVETTDLVFAVDSIPAVLAISSDSFIVFTSNVFAIMGLRSLFFAVSGFMKLFHYLTYGLAFILSFVGVKMIGAAGDWFHIPIQWSLLTILVVLGLSVAASLMWPKKGEADPPPVTAE